MRRIRDYIRAVAVRRRGLRKMVALLEEMLQECQRSNRQLRKREARLLELLRIERTRSLHRESIEEDHDA